MAERVYMPAPLWYDSPITTATKEPDMLASLGLIATGTKHAAVDAVIGPVAALRALPAAPVRLVRAHPEAARAALRTAPWHWRRAGQVWFFVITAEITVEVTE